jgi:hypothetical protein
MRKYFAVFAVFAQNSHSSHYGSERSERFFSFPPLTEMFHFSGYAAPLRGATNNSQLITNNNIVISLKVISYQLRCETALALVHSAGLPHSEIPGSKVATHLPEAYRSYATSFFAI